MTNSATNIDNTYTIRQICSDDLLSVSMLEQTLHYQPWTLEQIQDTLTAEYHYGWVAIDNENRTVGYLLAMIVADSADILTCGVDTLHQRRGLASLLLNTLKQTTLELQAEHIFLEVRESNKAARTCYQRAGFQETGRRRNYYTTPDCNREDAVVMVWSIETQ